MKTKLDERLEIKANFEVLESNSPANMPVNVQQKQKYKESVPCDGTIKDIFAKAKKIENETKAKEMLNDTIGRYMPYFYCK